MAGSVGGGRGKLDLTGSSSGSNTGLAILGDFRALSQDLGNLLSFGLLGGFDLASKV